MPIKSQPGRLKALDLRNAPAPPKKAEAHYGTGAHKAWARAVIARAGGRCEWCGSAGRLYADHIREIKDTPDLALHPGNGQALCAPCHTKKTIRAKADRLG